MISKFKKMISIIAVMALSAISVSAVAVEASDSIDYSEKIIDMTTMSSICVEEGQEVKAVISEDGMTAVLVGDIDDDTTMVLEFQDIALPYNAQSTNMIAKAVTLSSEVTTQTATYKNAYAMGYLGLKYINVGSNGLGSTNKICQGITGGWNLIKSDAVLSGHKACWWFDTILPTKHYADIDYANLTFEADGNAMPSSFDLCAQSHVDITYGGKEYMLNVTTTV